MISITFKGYKTIGPTMVAQTIPALILSSSNNYLSNSSNNYFSNSSNNLPSTSTLIPLNSISNLSSSSKNSNSLIGLIAIPILLVSLIIIFIIIIILIIVIIIIIKKKNGSNQKNNSEIQLQSVISSLTNDTSKYLIDPKELTTNTRISKGLFENFIFKFLIYF